MTVSVVKPHCFHCNGKGWVLEQHPYSEGNVEWEDCHWCNGLGRVQEYADNAKD